MNAELEALRALALAFPTVARLAEGADDDGLARLEGASRVVGGDPPDELVALYRAHDGLGLGVVEAPEVSVLELVPTGALLVVRGEEDGEPRLPLFELGDDGEEGSRVALGFDGAGRARLALLWEGDLVAERAFDVRAVLRLALSRARVPRGKPLGRALAWETLFGVVVGA